MSSIGSPTPNSNATGFQSITASSRKQIEEVEERLTSFVPEIIAANVGQRELRPEGPLDTDWSLILSKEFQFGGYAGLGRAVQRLAKETKNDARTMIKKNYEDIEGGANNVSIMITLATMNTRFLRAMLEGTLFCEIEEDAEFRRAALGLHGLRKSPGNYCQAFVRKSIKRSSTQSQVKKYGIFKPNVPNSGKSITPRQFLKLYDTAARYLPSDPNTTNPVLAYKIDSIFQPGVKGYRLDDYRRLGVRKYCEKDIQEKKLVEWLDVLNETWIKRIEKIEEADADDPVLDEPMKATPLEIGWGVDLQARANSHDDHRSSNNVFTFYQALVRYVCDPDGLEYHVPRYCTHLIFDPKNAYKEAQFGDVGMTLLAQSEWLRGGLNPQPGGGGGVNQQSVEERKSWILESQRLLFANGTPFFENMKEDDKKIKRLKYLNNYDATAKRVDIKKRAQECLEKCHQIDVLDRIVQVADCEAVLNAFEKLKQAGQVVMAAE